MTEPNATPTRADVLREHAVPPCRSADCECDSCDAARSLADEVLRLRTRWDAMIRRVEALRGYDDSDIWYMRPRRPMYLIDRAAVLAALREGGENDSRKEGGHAN